MDCQHGQPALAIPGTGQSAPEEDAIEVVECQQCDGHETVVLRQEPDGAVAHKMPNKTRMVVLESRGDSALVQLAGNPEVKGWAKVVNLSSLSEAKVGVPAKCRSACGLPAAPGFPHCCRTCKATQGVQHGPSCIQLHNCLPAEKLGRRLPALVDGGEVRLNSALITTGAFYMYHSATSYTGFGSGSAGTLLVSGGPVQLVDGFATISLLPRGAVIANAVRVRKPNESRPSFSSLWEALEDGSTALVRGTWIQHHSINGRPLLCRQDLEQIGDALWTSSELKTKVESYIVQIFAVSYCWYAARKPDPNALQCRTLASMIKLRLDELRMPLEDVAVFLDWCSLYQRPRSKGQDAAFSKGLSAVSNWYLHEDITVLQLTRVPAQVRPYRERGWPTFEQALACLLKEGTKVLDIGCIQDACSSWYQMQVDCTKSRVAPLTPSAFRIELSTKVFTNSADHEVVNAMYQKAFEEAASSVTTLNFSRLTWASEDLERLGQTLAMWVSLRDLTLGTLLLAPESVELIAPFIVQCQSLQNLRISNATIFLRGSVSLAKHLPKCQSLEVADFNGSSIRDEGMAVLAPSLAAIKNLKKVALTSCGLTDVSVAPLVAALSACEKLLCFEMMSCPSPDQSQNVLSESGKRRLRNAWSQSAKNPKFLFL